MQIVRASRSIERNVCEVPEVPSWELRFVLIAARLDKRAVAGIRGPSVQWQCDDWLRLGFGQICCSRLWRRSAMWTREARRGVLSFGVCGKKLTPVLVLAPLLAGGLKLFKFQFEKKKQK